jgi:glycosyltransferase involved in cell wall biosynthesis
MKNVLIISYFFPPGNFVASNRVKSFAENLKNYGLNPIVLTRHWEGHETLDDLEEINENPIRITEKESYMLIQVPYLRKWYCLCKPFHGIPFLSQLSHFFYVIAGVFEHHYGAHECFYDYLNEYLQKNKIDCIVVTSQPLNIIKLGHLISQKFKIPLVVDFRDLWDNKILSNKPLSLENRLRNFFYELYLKKWLKSADLVISVSLHLLEEISRLSPDTKKAVVMNGFEIELYEKFSKYPALKHSKFTFSLIGTVYPHQDITIAINGLKRFLENKDLSKIQLNFIGTAVYPEVAQYIKENLPEEILSITARVPREKAIQKLLASDVLYYVGWSSFKGIISAKFFEYLSTGKKIIISPSDEDILDIVAKTGVGKVADTVEEFAAALELWHKEWETNGYLKSEVSPEKIMYYSREKQAELLALEIVRLS